MKTLAPPTSVVVPMGSPASVVTSSPSSAHVRTALLVLKVRGHTPVSVSPDTLDGTVNWTAMTVNLTHARMVSLLNIFIVLLHLM